MRRITASLAGRLLLASLLILPLFLGLLGFNLDRSYRLGLEAAEEQRLHLHVLTLLAEAEYDDSLWFPEQLLEPRLNQPDSGLYAYVTDAEAKLLWSSGSAITLGYYPEPRKLATGGSSFARRGEVFDYTYRILWQTEAGLEVHLLFTVLEHAGPLEASLAVYRQSLATGLGGVTLLLIICQGLLLLWGLQPLRRLARDIDAIEYGTSESLKGNYPTEVQALTKSLNTLIAGERLRRERVRNTLGDLAHSLKTPLAVLRSGDSSQQGFDDLVKEQTNQMSQIVDYQLQRAVGGSHRLLGLVSVMSVVERLRDSLVKVYANKNLLIDVAISAATVFRGDERDLMEVMGNLMDNACKYGSQHVRVGAIGGGTTPLKFWVEDDGEGIHPKMRPMMIGRGMRADTRHLGQGIGLAVAVDIVASYQGSLMIDDSPLGGALVSVELP
ncbi:MAG: two-component system sensor histidine kinase PhoQ [Halieaceae bacterium]|jgi:two-component system sensor histidine kinase PhoQ